MDYTESPTMIHLQIYYYFTSFKPIKKVHVWTFLTTKF